MKYKTYNIEFFKNLALTEGGICLSKDYDSIRKKLDWQCKHGHLFSLAPNKIFTRNYWCEECTGRRTLHTKESIQKIAKNRGWLFLSNDYTIGSRKYKFQCDKGHIIDAIAHNVIRGAGCRTCAGKQLLTIDIFKKIASDKEGECLSSAYEGQKVPLKFRCKEGHIFNKLPGELKNSGTWCKKCAGLELGTIEEMVLLAKENGGECLSNEYINNTSKLIWMCADNHIWEATPRDIKHSKSWCPQCTWYTNERKCNYIFEKLLGVEFRKTRKILENGLELDGYSVALKLAFEYNGEQHYHTNYFNNDDLKLLMIKNRDIKKVIECKDKNIQLIIVPYFENKDDSQLVNFIKKELTVRNISFIDVQLEVLMKDFYISNSALKNIQELALRNGDKLFSTKYINSQFKMELVCKNGHIWSAAYSQLKKNKSCPICSGLTRLTIDEMREIAREKRGECLSNEIVNSQTPIKWKCEEGHIWEATPTSVRNSKTWCLICSGKAKLTIEDMEELARNREGKCLSRDYINNSTNLLWECKHGHQWEAQPQAIKNKRSWCPYCSGRLKF